MAVILFFAYVFRYKLADVFAGLEEKYYARTGGQNGAEWLNPKSKIDYKKITSPALGGKTKEVVVYLPEAYGTQPHKKFPVLYLLHGFPGNSRQWIINSHLKKYLDEAIKNQALRPVIVVCPDGNGPAVGDSQYVNLPSQKMEDYISKDVVGFIDSNYRTIPDRKSRGIGGNSSGAYGAINIALKNNQVFSLVLSFSGYFGNWDNQLGAVFGNDQTAIDSNSPKNYIGQAALESPTNIFLGKGSLDWGALGKSNEDFAGLLANKHVNYQLVTVSGIHGWPLWEKMLPSALVFLNQNLDFGE